MPDRLSVAGFDGVPSAAAAELTTVAQDHAAKGRTAAEVLLATLRGAPIVPPAALPYELVIRASTSPAPVSDS